MICQKCKRDYPEKEIDISHDVPRYIGGTDSDGRHNICRKCHDIYEKTVFSIMTKNLSIDIKKEMRNRAIAFAKQYFKEAENVSKSG